jgi:hypothetical protein
MAGDAHCGVDPDVMAYGAIPFVRHRDNPKRPSISWKKWNRCKSNQLLFASVVPSRPWHGVTPLLFGNKDERARIVAASF